jgi:flagellar hook-associated protein 3 FlgL
MSMRITNSMIMRTSLNGVHRARQQLSETQEQAATGLRVNRPSDDPAAASRAARLRDQGRAVDQYRRNIVQARARLGTIENALDSGREAIVRAKEIAVQGANGTIDANSRRILAQQVESIHDELLGASNARNAGGWLFGGSATGVAAFSASGPFVSGSSPPTVTFGGDSNEVEVAIDEGRRASSTLDGRRVFQGDTDGDGLPDAGREDAFAVLGELWRALDTNDQSAVAATLDRIDRTQRQFELETARVGASNQELDAADGRLQLAEVSITTFLSDTEDADTEDVFSRLVAQETALDAALQTASRAIQPSLLDFLN